MKAIYLFFIKLYNLVWKGLNKIMGKTIHFGEPTIWPTSLDEFYDLVDNGKGNWVFTGELPENPGSVLTWSMVKQLATYNEGDLARLIIPCKDFAEIIYPIPFPKEGTLDISEDELFSLFMWVMLMGVFRMIICPMTV